MQKSPKPLSRLLLLVLAAAGVLMMTGCHFHRYHHEHYEYDEFDYHPRYGTHHN